MKKKAAGPAPAKRKRGRPRAVHGPGGRDAIIAAARQLLEKMRPHRVTMVLIARKAGVDPALLRYYFKSREYLLLAVVESILADWAAHPAPDQSPADQLSNHLANMLEFSRNVRSMQRLLVEECAESKSAAVRARVQELSAQVVDQLAGLLRPDGKAEARSAEALFLHVAMIGICEFYAASQAVILPLAPKGMTADELASRYDTFIHDLVLDGVRKRLRSARGRH
ncbi:TetR family transcriptional regulator [bacterium]|nr:MAG: TetR family transcriptional regulator [bacterium]